MKAYIAVMVLLVLLAGCSMNLDYPAKEACTKKDTKLSMSIREAMEIAKNSECAQQGAFKNYYCNDFTGTVWMDMEMNEPKEGCNPACVVNIESREAEINWRCTGLIVPKEK
jgi:hypothetical protein